VHPEAVAEAFHAWEMGTTNVNPLSLAATSNQTIQESMKLLTLVRAYQVQGHLNSQLDPLDHTQRPPIELLDPKFYGFSESDLDREFYVGTWDTKVRATSAQVCIVCGAQGGVMGGMLSS
jgi:2-oxoglutarate dehydrogenase E1 component